ncbi:Uncharacterised protein [Mycobacteroides abscessus]|nr:Uncharacterised protein [Mycobacteroides abscessus]
MTQPIPWMPRSASHSRPGAQSSGIDSRSTSSTSCGISASSCANSSARVSRRSMAPCGGTFTERSETATRSSAVNRSAVSGRSPPPANRSKREPAQPVVAPTGPK